MDGASDEPELRVPARGLFLVHTVPLENGEHVPERALDIDQIDSFERNPECSVDFPDQFGRVAAVKRAGSPVRELRDHKAGAQRVLSAKLISRGDADVRDQMRA